MSRWIRISVSGLITSFQSKIYKKKFMEKRLVYTKPMLKCLKVQPFVAWMQKYYIRCSNENVTPRFTGIKIKMWNIARTRSISDSRTNNNFFGFCIPVTSTPKGDKHNPLILSREEQYLILNIEMTAKIVEQYLLSTLVY